MERHYQGLGSHRVAADLTAMSDDQIASALGQIIGKLDALQNQFHDYIDRHDQRHDKIDEKIEDHAAQINQAKGAKGAVLWLAGLVGALAAYLVKKIVP